MGDNGFGNGSAMIALLPVTNDWCKVNDPHYPHMTLVYAGKLEDLSETDFGDLAKDASSLALVGSPLYIRVKGVEVMGKGDDDNPLVNALVLQPTPELLSMRKFVEHWNASEFPFKPHCTIGPTGPTTSVPLDLPTSLAFDRIMVGWGEEQLIFSLRR